MSDGVLIRIFNAEGEAGIRKIKLNFPYKSIQEIELNGETKQTDLSIKANSASELLISIPKFGLRTFKIKN
jgi:alpha-mannosidase